VQPTRRSVLTAAAVGGAAAGLTGCTSKTRTAPAPVDPDVALRTAAAAREQALLDAYDAVIAASPAQAARLAPLRAEHVEHLTALGATAAPGRAAATDLKALERITAAAHATAVLTASRRLAPLLASLAAAESTHVVVL
jgi:hypothetical protein